MRSHTTYGIWRGFHNLRNSKTLSLNAWEQSYPISMTNKQTQNIKKMEYTSPIN